MSGKFRKPTIHRNWMKIRDATERNEISAREITSSKLWSKDQEIVDKSDLLKVQWQLSISLQ